MVAKHKKQMDLSELVASKGTTWAAVVHATGMSPAGIWRVRKGLTEPQEMTEIRLANALAVERSVLRAAIAESRRRAAAGMYE